MIFSADVFNNETYDDILKTFSYKLIVVANPDGYKYTFFNQLNRGRRIHRKNRGGIWCSRGESGVDLNRNIPPGFKEDLQVGRLTDPCSNVYRGPAPFSEPETRAIRDAMTSDPPWFMLSVHGNGQAWMCPYAYNHNIDHPKHEIVRENVEDLRKVAQIFPFGDYSYGQSSDVYGNTPGTLQDWVFEELGVNRSYTVEMKDLCTRHDDGLTDLQDSICEFQPDVEKARETILPETWAGFTKLIKLAFQRDCVK